MKAEPAEGVEERRAEEMLQSIFDCDQKCAMLFELSGEPTGGAPSGISPLVARKNLMQLLTRQNLDTNSVMADNPLPAYSAKHLDVLLMTTNFFKLIPQKEPGFFVSDARRALVPRANNRFLTLSPEACQCLKQKVLQPYFLSNQTKLHFDKAEPEQRGQAPNLHSIMDVIKVFMLQNVNELTVYFQSTEAISRKQRTRQNSVHADARARIGRRPPRRKSHSSLSAGANDRMLGDI